MFYVRHWCPHQITALVKPESALRQSIPGVAAVNWTGQVVDLRTGQPIPNVQVYGGAQGRVDLTAASLTGPDGFFSVSYDAALDLGFWNYYMLTATYNTTAGAYFWYISKAAYPAYTVAHMVPRYTFIRGVVRDTVTGQVMPGAQVSLGVPGAYMETVVTDAQGNFQFNPYAYEGSNNYEEGIPLAEQVPHDGYPTAQRKTNYWLEVSASGYRTQNTADQGTTINLLSSITPAIHTWVNLDMIPNSTNLPPGVTVQMVDPYGLQLWLAQYFTAQQMTNAAYTNATADPDGDGLANQQEYEIGTNPSLRDTDNDTLPDVALGIRRAVRVDYPTLSGVRYQLVISDSLSGPWTHSGAAFSGNGTNVTQYFEAETTHQQFYRVNIIAE